LKFYLLLEVGTTYTDIMVSSFPLLLSILCQVNIQFCDSKLPIPIAISFFSSYSATLQANLADSFLADLDELSDNEGYPVS